MVLIALTRANDLLIMIESDKLTVHGLGIKWVVES